MPGAQRTGGLRILAVGVFDMLRLIQDGCGKFHGAV